MTDYLDFQIETDADALANLAYQEMASRIPGWDPIAGEIDTALIQANARIASQVRASAGIVPIGVFRYLAAQFGLQASVAVAATGIATLQVRDTLGHTIPAGTQYTITDTSGIEHGFQTTVDAVVPGGSNFIAGVPLVAITPGADANNMPTGFTDFLSPVDALGYLDDTSTFTTTTTGGADAETDDNFLARLVRRYQLQSAAPILPSDFAALALDVLPVGSRTIPIDGYDAVALTSGNARTITVVAIDVNGNVLSAPTRAAVVAYLNTLREVNWLIYCIDPVLFQVSVKWTAHAIPGYNTTAVNNAIIAAVQAYLSPKSWGYPALESLTNWTLLEGYDKVRLGELYQLINAVEGVAYVDTLNLVAGAAAPVAQVADITLTGGLVVMPTTVGASITGSVS